MENDYLWDKTGHDADIERLEKSLLDFRYQPRMAPRLPVERAESRPVRRFTLFPAHLRTAFAATAFLLVALFSVGIWSQIGTRPLFAAKDSALEVSPFTDFNLRAPAATKTPADRVPVNFGKPTLSMPFARPTTIAVRRPVRRFRNDRSVALTKAERAAFDQLMLALSITGSKLKAVQDKANGIDELSAQNKLLKEE